MDIKINNTAAAIDDAKILVSSANKLSSVVSTMRQLKINFENNWIEEGVENENRKRIVESLAENIIYYESKIIPALEKLGNAINSYAIITEQIASASIENQTLIGVTPSQFSDSIINSKEYLFQTLSSFDNNVNVEGYSKDLLAKYGNNYSKIENFENYGNVLYEKLNLKEYGYENGIDFLNDYMNQCQSLANNNRNKSIYSALGFTNLASSINMKADYDWGGGHNNTTISISELSEGLDCSGYVSYLIQQGSANEFSSMTTTSLRNIGNGCDISLAQGGDITVRNGHTMFILSNDVQNKTMIVTEAANSNKGIVVREYNYNDLLNSGYKFRDLSSIYGE